MWSSITSDPILLGIIENPISVPSLIITFFMLSFLIILQLSVKIASHFIGDFKILNAKQRRIQIFLLLLSVFIFLFTVILIFYNMATMPPGCYEDDEGTYAIGTFILKNKGHDWLSEKMIPYFPFMYASYHGEHVWGFCMRGLASYCLVFLQYLFPPGYFCLRLENALFTLLGSILITYSYWLMNKNISASLICGALFNILPWTRFLANMSPEISSYCFGSACYLFSVFYLIYSRKFIGVVYYVIASAILLFSYMTGFMLAIVCVVCIPLALFRHQQFDKKLSLKILLLGVGFLYLLYLNFCDEPGFKWNLGRGSVHGCLPGLASFNLGEMIQGIKNNWQVFSGNYLGYLSPQFLFLTGDGHRRQNSDFGGELFVTLFIAFYLSFFSLIDKRNINPYMKTLLVYFLFSIIPYSICKGGMLNPQTHLPLHSHTQCGMIPPVAIITTLGLHRIFKINRIYFLLYAIAISVNVYLFYYDYFNVYPQKVTNSWFDDPGLQIASRRAYDEMKNNPGVKLLYVNSYASFLYYYLDRLKTDDVFYGNGLLANIDKYDSSKNSVMKEGDLLLTREPFDPTVLQQKSSYILRVRNHYLPDDPFGTSLLKIIK